MTGPDPREELTPSERRLHEHLELLSGADAPQPTTALVRHIVRRARWQLALRRPLLAVATISQAAVDAVRLLFSPRPGH